MSGFIENIKTIYMGMTASFSAADMVVVALSAAVIAVFIGLLYEVLYGDDVKNMKATLIVVSLSVAMVSMTTTSQIIIAILVFAVFSVIKMDAGNIKDSCFILWAISIGFACGIQFVPLAASISLIAGILLYVISFLEKKNHMYKIKIEYRNEIIEDEISDMIKSFDGKYNMTRKKITSDGNFETEYNIKMKKESMDFINSLGQINGVNFVDMCIEK
ncbi:hypothetical protein EXD82_04155 [Peptacetobacter hominis]|uniref:DUF4956 domain-containing protein n=1 Tax=Peptacetobacter hominis TaxID=2743610 RepID=A0A544QVV1_9FIRM|nr:hypothetical protein [Peptacetobacter hominis]TQQ84825.1 hypothetical protein EXD82_04155 [Peptacetobacter hominis]